ncbi:sel1 repeat family protein [Paraburkholderia phenoliruptrix]|uniref:sel1 repeat family protein n=1 Tax=Paraburkholderia phenoliruptrix TaxID=252970 RepID=UPI0034CEA3BE
MKKIAILLSIILMLTACIGKDNAISAQSEAVAARDNLAFTCVHETDHLPALDPETDQLFKYGRYLEKKDGAKDYTAVARYYRIAAAHGHYKANNNLQQLVSTGLAPSPDAPNETLDLAERLIAASIPGGYYDMGHYLELGYGVKQDHEKALKYFRKAADLGSPEAQFYVGDLLSPREKAPDVSRQMMECATDQGYARAANYLGEDLSTDKLYADAVQAFQKGVSAGDTQSAFALQNGFDTDPSNALYYLGLPKDAERSRRYKLIGDLIDNNDGLNPKVPDIDKIVPLPPAKLPPWDGTFQWQKEQDAAAPPQKPSEELVDRLAKSKNLDPATGLPLSSGEAKTSQVDEPAETRARTPIGTTARAGARCPENGVWCAQIRPELQANTTRTFSKGDVFPLLDVYEPRPLALLDNVFGKRRYTTDAVWKLVAYEQA